MEEKKRKTTTSTQVKRRWNEKNYTRVRADLPKELVERFKKKCDNEGISYASVIRKAIEDFLGE